MIKSIITDPLNKKSAGVSNSGGFLRTSSKDYWEHTNVIRYFVNDQFGTNFAVNGFPSGLYEHIYDGSDNTYWTRSIIVGSPSDFLDSTDQNHTDGGSQSLDFSPAEHGDTVQFQRPGGLMDLTYFSVINGWIYITEWLNLSKEIKIYGWNTVTDAMVGIPQNLSNYVNTSNQLEWLPFTIPFYNMGLTGQTLDAIRIEMVDVGAGSTPDGYLDDIQFIGASGGEGGPYKYYLKPQEDELIVHRVTISMSSDYDNTLTDSSMPNLDYNKLLNVALVNGILYQRVDSEGVITNVGLRNLIHFLSLPGMRINSYGSNGSGVFLTLSFDFEYPEILSQKNRDELNFIIADDLSPFTWMSISASCSTRSIADNGR